MSDLPYSSPTQCATSLQAPTVTGGRAVAPLVHCAGILTYSTQMSAGPSTAGREQMGCYINTGVHRASAAGWFYPCQEVSEAPLLITTLPRLLRHGFTHHLTGATVGGASPPPGTVLLPVLWWLQHFPDLDLDSQGTRTWPSVLFLPSERCQQHRSSELQASGDFPG